MSSKQEINDSKSGSLARGKRLKTARMMTGLTRNALEKRYNISASTIQSWEAAKAGGLTARGVSRILPVLHKEGVMCTAAWLLHGIGIGPQPTYLPIPFSSQEEITASSHTQSDNKAIVQELLTFRNLHGGASDLVVSDNGMEPHYRTGDYIAGVRHTKEKMMDVLDTDCIVQTVENTILFRRLKRGSQPGLYNLICINPDTTVFETTLYDQALVSAAPVIWHRRKNIF
jgi:transcriptional regulator with XRE-family HTH domain